MSHHTDTNTNNGNGPIKAENNTWNDPASWRKLCPLLTISDTNATNALQIDLSQEEKQLHSDDLLNDGYTLLDSTPYHASSQNTEHQNHQKRIQNITKSIDILRQSNHPLTAIFLYDEPWHLASWAGHTMQSITHPENHLNYDMLAFHVNPKVMLQDGQCEAGFSPHRDRQPECVSSSFHGEGEGGHAKYVTLWLALTDASPENSCLYVIPKGDDPGYIAGDDAEDENDNDSNSNINTNKNQNDSLATQSTSTASQPKPKDPLAKALPTKESYQNIRALPRQAGQAVVFTHRILHWGSRGNHGTKRKIQPRVALSFVASHASFEPPYLVGASSNASASASASANENANSNADTDANANAKSNADANTNSNADANAKSNANANVNAKSNADADAYANKRKTIIPSFHQRALLAASQTLVYHERFRPTSTLVRSCYQFVKKHEVELEVGYRRKVFAEFVVAMRQAKEREFHCSKDTNGSKRKGGKEDPLVPREKRCKRVEMDGDGSKEIQKKEGQEEHNQGDTKDSKKSSNKDVTKHDEEEESEEGDEEDGPLTFRTINQTDNDDNDNDDDEEAMLEEMLNAEEGGYGGDRIHDDFDQAEEEEEEGV